MNNRPVFASAHMLSASTSRRSVLKGASVLGMSVFAAGGLAACGQTNGEPSGGTNTGGGAAATNLGLSVPFLTTPFFAVLDTYVKAEVEDQGASMLQAVNANQDAGKQLGDVRSLVDLGATGILAGVVDNQAIKPALDYCEEQDIPFVALDDAPGAGHVYVVVRADNYEMGATSAEKMAELIGGEGKVLSIQGDLATTNGRDRSDGFRVYMEENHPQIEVIERPANWEGPAAGSITSTILTQYRDLAGIYMQADTTYGSAVLASLDSAGRLHPAGHEDHMPLVAIDGGAEGLDAVRAGTIDALVSQPLDSYAKYGVEYVIKANAGETLEVGPTDHDSEIVEFQGNLMDLLPATLVTQDNVDDDALWGNNPNARA